MNRPLPSRRTFLRSSAAAVTVLASRGIVASGAPPRDDAPATARPLRVGAPLFNPPHDPEELAAAHRHLGMRAAYCPDVKLDDTPRIRAIEQAFAKQDVVIAEVGRWVNLLAADPAERQANLDIVAQGLALADEIGALCCVDIAGSFNTECWYGPHPENLSDRFFEAAVENARKIIDSVKPKRAKFCYEMMGWALPDSPDSYLRMLRAVERPAFGVHLDPANLINSPERIYRNTDLLNECFDKLGPWIVSCHAKDVAWRIGMQIHFEEVVLGAGELDYVTFLRRLAQLPHDAPLMIEHMQNEEEYDRSRRHLFDVGKQAGLVI
jgi:sugar phosphate isomerase/epimerase